MEVHRLTGLIRFSELEGGVLYAPIDPDNDVLEFLAPHFSDRYRYDPFIIHDKSRCKALFSYDKTWRIEPFDGEMLSPARKENISQSVTWGRFFCLKTEEPSPCLMVSESENNIRDLWKQYFEVMATKERINLKHQRQFVPVRYRKHLPEFDEKK